MFNSRNTESAVQVLRDLNRKLRDRAPDPDEFDANFRQIVFTRGQTSQKELIRYILKKVQNEEGSPTVGESDDLTIEHLIPQASDRDETIVGQIGNLILVDKVTNGRLADRRFSEKKKILHESGYRLPSAFTEVDDLTDEIIEENTMRVSKLSRSKVWSI
ncbi:HNH endonuclease family protein [Maritalea mediterranea]|uniref:HNH endonuclease family protein n=1 Tax=Maritalea mediterranea TaxID=2909667 RepID=A0ABS9E410_9HYPH|nr:HNH endonuclease family protein [Maritalea mediterranea]MCF4097609.1 HNH endonuclease family protein [Maritalea mediterranea]